jgi:hypothetical protein
MKGRQNRVPANVFMAGVVFMSILIGMAGLLRALFSGLGIGGWDWNHTLTGVAGVAVCLTGYVIYRISRLDK